MSDYMFMLENHLSADQNRVVEEVRAAAAQANVNLFLGGGAMRDVLGGFQVRDLDFITEGDALQVADILAARPGVTTVSIDREGRAADFLFPGGVTAQVAATRSRHPGQPPPSHVGIQEDLRGRDFSVNAIAISLNRASRGLLLDPANGLADLERRELRTLYSAAFRDDPVRLLRMVRLRVRLGFAVEERTAAHAAAAIEAGAPAAIPPRDLFEELRSIAAEPSPAEVVRALDAERLLAVFCPALTGSKLNLTGLARLERASRLFESETPRAARLGPFLHALTEKLTPKERAELVRTTGMTRAEAGSWQKLELRARKLEQALKSARVRKPSQVYQILSKAPGDEVCFVLYRSQYKPVQERVKNYFQKYLPLARQLNEADLEAAGAPPGSPRWEKKRMALLAAHLDRRVRRAPAAAAAPAATVETSPRRRTANG